MGKDDKQSASDLDKSWSGHSTFRPMRHAEDEDEGMPRQAGSGLYGFTKDIQSSVEAGTRKLSRYAHKTAAALWAKDPKTAEFLATHARKADSLPAKALLSAMSEIGPKVDKVAAGRTHGLYGFRNKTAKNALIACQGLREEAGFVAHELASRKATKYSDLIGYMEKHCESTNCPFTTLLKQAMPEDRVALVRMAQDSGAGSAHNFFFDDPKRKEVREFAQSNAPTNVMQVIPKIVQEYEVLDEKPSTMKREVNKSPLTPDEVLDETAGSDEFSTLSRYLVMTKTPTSEPVPEGVHETPKAPDLSRVHKKVTEKYLKKLAQSRR